MRSRFLAGVLAVMMVLVPVVMSRAEPPPTTQKSADLKTIVPVFRLSGQISEQPADEMAALFGGDQGLSLRQLVGRLNKAADDSAVKAVVMLDEGGVMGSAQLEEIRQAMQKVRAAGKDIYVHADSLSNGKYVLFSGASRLSVVPTADLWLMGLYAEQPYLRGLLDKIAVKPEFMTCGAYKSAAELFMREGPSPEADAMMNWLFDGIYQTHVELIARGRGVSSEQARAWIDGGPYSAKKAKALGLIDAIEHRQDFEQMLKAKFGDQVAFDRKYGQKKKPTFDLSSPLAIFKLWADAMASAKAKPSKDAVGIVYVDGAIMLGKGRSSPFGGSGGAFSTDIRKALDDAANDDTIKAVVLRVDSPGGSAVASEIILDGTLRAKARKPLVVSMGNVAGSGGYYVACGSDVIFADQSTITASIGVVFGKLITTEGWKKIGITWQGYKRGQNADVLSSAGGFTPEQRQKMQAWMTDIYEVFKGHVSEFRGSKLKKPLEEIAGGRVFTGRQALELGLVDKIGTLEDAIVYAAGQAKLTDYDVRVVPEPKNLIERIVEEASGGKDDPHRIAIGGGSLWELALPHLRGLDPARVEAIRMAFVQMQILQDEGVALITPPIVWGR